MHWRVEPFRRNETPAISFTFDDVQAQNNNGWLIFHTGDVADEPSPSRLFAGAAQWAASGGLAAENPGFEHGGGTAMRRRLNPFFAFGVNTPSMSMVNFPSPTSSAWQPAANGVVRRVTPDPVRAPADTEAGAHACI